MRRAQRLQLRHLAAPEVAVGELGMGHRQPRLGHHAIAVADDVQVQGAGPPALAALPAALPFDLQERAQQLARLERRLQQHHLVEEGSLPNRPERRRLLDPRGGHEPGVGQRGQALSGEREMRRAVADVRPQGHEDPFERGGWHGGILSAQATLAKPRVSSRSIPATCSSSRVACSSSASPRAASLARVATPSASPRFFPAISATALMRWRSRENASSCSPAADAMRWACVVASAVAATIASSASNAAADSSSTPPPLTCPRRICSTTSPTWRWMSCTSSPASSAAVALCSARRRTSSATTANPLPCFPARAASMVAFNASRFVMSASSRIEAMNPVMRRLTWPSSCTWPEASLTKVLSATSRWIASRICCRFLFATSLAVVDAWAASVPSSDTRRDTRARLSVASSPPETSSSSASTPWRIAPVDCATALAASRSDSAARARVASCRVMVSTVSSSGRRSSVIWIAVASWFANVWIVYTSLRRYILRLWCSSSSVPITWSPNLRGTITKLCT